MHSKTKVLFILKKRMTSHQSLKTVSSGLLNSASFVNEMLCKNGVHSHLVEVNDNNCIDREVTIFRPDIVIIEALWVVPSKFEILTKLHPNVKWIIRMHSEIPFIANEGIAMDWVYEYEKFNNVYLSVNSETAYKDFNSILKKKTIYLPNYYPVNLFSFNCKPKKKSNTLDIGCFGAVRPMKNQLYQAVAAIQFANSQNKILNFHINVARVENNGDPVLKNIRNLFKNNPKHNLVEHFWYCHHEFKQLISSLDMGLQVSFTETFNIVAADFVDSNVPVVVSEQIKWLSCLYKASPTDSDSIRKKISFALKAKSWRIQYLNKIRLWFYGLSSQKTWIDFIKKEDIKKTAKHICSN